MKKILLTTIAFLFCVSFAFAEREAGMDLQDIFGRNQLGAGYDGAEWDTSLYADFGTDKLRFSVNILDLGGSWVNNGDLTKNSDTTTSSVPFTQGLPRFFVGAGYKFSDTFRAAIGYGGKLIQFNEGFAKSGYYGNDVSVFFQANVGASTIKFATPIQFGKGYGNKKIGIGTSPDYAKYDNKNFSTFSMKPEVRWIGQAGPLVQIRFAVPVGMATAKSQKAETSLGGEIELEEKKLSTIGADLRVYLRFATDPVQIQFVPRIRYNQAMKGGKAAVTVMDEPLYDDEARPLGFSTVYNAERPWTLRVDLPIDLTASSDLVTVWAAPQLNFYAVGAPKLTAGGGTIIRKENLYGLGYGLPLEITIKPIPNFDVNIGMEGFASTPLTGGSTELGARVDGSVVWYF